MPLRIYTTSLLRSGTAPVVRTRNCKLRRILDVGWDKHRFVTRQYRLAECDVAASVVLAPYRSCTADTVGLVGEWLLNVSVLVAKQPTILLPISTKGKAGVGTQFNTID